MCLVETSKALLELEAPGGGILHHLYAQGDEVELGGRIAVIAESEEELDAAEKSRPAKAESPAPTGPANATWRAVELAEDHGIDLASIEKDGFITAEDVERLVAARAAEEVAAAPGLFAGISLEGVTLPAVLDLPESAGRLDESFLESLRSDPDSFRALSSDERYHAYRRAGASIGENVRLGERTIVVAPRIVLEDGVEIGDDGDVYCEEVFAVGALTSFGARLDVRCRRAFIGANGHLGRDVRIGGGGWRDPWATLAVGDLVFVGDEAFVNPCRPVVIGREVFLTMRSLLVTHNIGHSVLEGFENRFAPIVLEDRAQIGLGTVVYAGCRVGREAIVASNSYVVSDIAAGQPRSACRPRSSAPPRALCPARGSRSSCGGSGRLPRASRATRRGRRRRLRSCGRHPGGRGRRRSCSSSRRWTGRSSRRRRTETWSCSRSSWPASRRPAAPCSISLRGVPTARAAWCSTRCASSAASAASASSQARGGTAAALSDPAQGSFSQGSTARRRGIALSTAASPAGMKRRPSRNFRSLPG